MRRPVRACLPPVSGWFPFQGESHEHQDGLWEQRKAELGHHARQREERRRRTPLFPHCFHSGRGVAIAAPALDPKPRQQKQSSRALCRTRTDDPFLTMEGRGCYDRSATLTTGHELPVNRHKAECTAVVAEIRSRWNWWTENGRKPRSTRVTDCQRRGGRGTAAAGRSARPMLAELSDIGTGTEATS